jgi:nitrate/nitrite-specific signal transduction histidine kinase
MNVAHILTSRIGALRMSLLSLEASPSVQAHLDACGVLANEIVTILQRVTDTVAHGRPSAIRAYEHPHRQGVVPLGAISRDLHQIAGCIAPLRFQLLAAAEHESDTSCRERIRGIAAINDSAGKILTHFRAEWIEPENRGTLGDALRRSLSSLENVLTVAVNIRDQPAFEQLAANRFVSEFLEEALTNAWKHGQEPVELTAEHDTSNNEIRISVRDGGTGFDPAEVQSGQGITVLRESAASLGGELGVSTEPSTVTLSFPFEA